MAVSKNLLFLPDWSSDNPYQKLLYDALRVSGVNCSGMSGKGFTFRWLLDNWRTYQYIHFHWLFGIYDLDNTGLTVKKAGIFLTKIIFARIMGYRVIWTVHNLISHEPTNLKCERVLRKITGRMVNHIIVHCNYAKRKVIDEWRIGSAKIAVIPHGSYIGHYPNNTSREEARKRLGIAADSFTFLFFGMVRGYKGINRLVESFKDVKKQFPNISLIIAGRPFDGQIKCEIESIAAEEGISHHLRYILDDEVQYFFNAADVVVLPYQNILTSGGAILALSFGKPVIVPAIGCLPELIDDEIGFVYTNGNQLAGKMLEAIKATDIHLMGRKAFSRAEEIKWGRVVDENYLSLLGITDNGR